MIIGFGFGSPLVSLIMLLATSFLSYLIFRTLKNRQRPYQDGEQEREIRRQYYIEQRARAYAMMREFDLSDQEIEEQLDRELGKS